jgi:spore germination cell wall hydrolase CwlJ-like protein
VRAVEPDLLQHEYPDAFARPGAFPGGFPDFAQSRREGPDSLDLPLGYERAFDAAPISKAAQGRKPYGGSVEADGRDAGGRVDLDDPNSAEARAGRQLGGGLGATIRAAIEPQAGAGREQAGRNAPTKPGGLNGFGYVSRGRQDIYNLARIMYAEALGIPEDYEGIGWVTANRAGRPGYGSNITEVIHQPGQYESVAAGNRHGRDSIHWTRFAQPELLNRQEQKARARAFQVAEAILDGRQPDVTNGATHFQTPNSGSRWFAGALAEGRLEQLPYQSKSTNPDRHLFYREAAPPKPDR